MLDRPAHSRTHYACDTTLNGVREIGHAPDDLRIAIRALWRAPGFAVAAILTLAVGIGANTAIFSVADGVLLRPAPFIHFDRLVMVWQTDRVSGTRREPASTPDYFDVQRRSRSFASLAAFSVSARSAGMQQHLCVIGICARPGSDKVLRFLSGALLLCVVAVIANYVPARRATGVDPLVALRND